jgi:hypothetical protein
MNKQMKNMMDLFTRTCELSALETRIDGLSDRDEQWRWMHP